MGRFFGLLNAILDTDPLTAMIITKVILIMKKRVAIERLNFKWTQSRSIQLKFFLQLQFSLRF